MKWSGVGEWGHGRGGCAGGTGAGVPAAPDGLQPSELLVRRARKTAQTRPEWLLGAARTAVEQP